MSSSTLHRTVLAMALALAYVLYRIDKPDLPVVVPVTPATGLAAVAQQMTAEERAALRDFYSMLGTAIGADPENEPVFSSTTDVRKANRAGMLVVWRGALANKEGKYPALREELEKYLATAVGLDDVPMNPTRKQEIAKSLQSLSEQFR